MSRQGSGFGGLDLVDVLVGVAVVATLAGIALPLIPKARHDSSRASTMNNLRQVACAMHNYASASPDGGTLPTGNWSVPEVLGSGPFAAILPFMEQLPTVPPATAIKVYVSNMDFSNGANLPGLTSFTYNSGWLGRPADVLPSEKLPNLDRVPDGTANTLLVTEQVMNCGGTLNPWHANRGLDGLRFTGPGVVTWADPPRRSNLGPNAPCLPNAPSGAFAGLILVAMGDASVRSVAISVAGSASGAAGVTNWQAAITPDGKETLGEDW